MPNLSSPKDIADSLSAPLGELIAAVGRGVAEAQQALDEATIETWRRLYSDEAGQLLMRLGYQPTWYKIPEASAEISVSLSISGEVEPTAATGLPAPTARVSKIKLYAVPVDASYTNKYDYDFKAASLIRFKVVAVPPSPQGDNIKVVPNLALRPYSDARALLTQLDIAFEQPVGVADTAVVQSTEPKAGEVLFPGQAVVIKFK